MSATAVPWLLFRIGEHQLSIPLGAVAEVTPAARPRLIPLVPLELGGIVNLRGEPLPVVDGGRLLGIDPRAEPSHTIVLEQGNARVGVLVEQVSRIDSRFRPGPPYQGTEVLPGVSLVEWVHRDRELVGLVDPEALFASATALLADRVTEEGAGRCSAAF